MTCTSCRWLVILAQMTFACASAPPAATAVATPPPRAASPESAAVRPARTPEEVEAAAARSPEARAAAGQGQNCEAVADLRDRAFCYLKSDVEASIDPLFALGRTILEKDRKYPRPAWTDFTYAAENAGVLAAKTSDARLHAGLRSAEETDHIFAIRAIGHMLAILRMGYGQGGATDESNRKLRLGAAHTACLASFSSNHVEMLRAGGACLKEIGDPSDAPALIDAVIAQSNAPELQRYLVEILAGSRNIPEPSLRKLAPVLARPLDSHWTHDEVSVRVDICTILMKELSPLPRWAQSAGAVAAREIGARSRPNACQKLAAGASEEARAKD